MEIRSLGEVSFESTEDMKVSGYVNEVGKLSQPLSAKRGKKFRERIAKGAFQRAIDRAKAAGKPIKLLLRHNSQDLLASTLNSSLELREDDIGLSFNATIIDTSVGRDAHAYVKSGLMPSMSFGFRNPVETWSLENGEQIRTLTDFDLTEISILDNPAYLDSSVVARGIDLVEDVEVPELKGDEEKRMEDEKTLENEVKSNDKTEERAYISRQYSKGDAMQACFECLGDLYSLQSAGGEDYFNFSDEEETLIDNIIDLMNAKIKEIRKNLKDASKLTIGERSADSEEKTEEKRENEEKTFTFTTSELENYRKMIETRTINNINIEKENANV